jgi:hypothetical protein
VTALRRSEAITASIANWEVVLGSRLRVVRHPASKRSSRELDPIGHTFEERAVVKPTMLDPIIASEYLGLPSYGLMPPSTDLNFRRFFAGQPARCR